MRLLVSGTRHQGEEIRRKVRDALNLQLEEWGYALFLILGDAAGVDSYAREWADNYDVDYAICHARWGDWGKAAGPVRNKKMFSFDPENVIVFPAPDSKGTYDVVKRANTLGIKPIKVEVM